MRAVPTESEDQFVETNGHDALDSIRSWLASGAQVVDKRRRLGRRHGTTKKLLVVDPASRQNGSERWHSTTSALQRHTVGGALSEMEPEHRRVITLAYLEGRTNREIAATLGVSVTTARRRLWAALERLEAIVSAAGAWLVAALVGFSVYLLARLARLTETMDKTERVAATITAGALAAAAVGIVTVIPDNPTTKRHGVPAAPAVQAPLGTFIVTPDSDTVTPGSEQSTSDATGGQGANAHLKDSAPAGQTNSGGPSNAANGCHGNPTGAPAQTPVGPLQGHLGPPVNPPGKGGCKGL